MAEMMHGEMWAWMLVWALVGVAVLVLAAVATFWLVRRASRAVGNDDGERPLQDSPEDVLRRRYAAGEIDEDEYLKRMSGLQRPW